MYRPGMAVEESALRIGASVFAAAMELTDTVKASTTRITKVRLNNITTSCLSLKDRLLNDKVAVSISNISLLQIASYRFGSLVSQIFCSTWISFGGYSFYAKAS